MSNEIKKSLSGYLAKNILAGAGLGAISGALTGAALSDKENRARRVLAGGMVGATIGGGIAGYRANKFLKSKELKNMLSLHKGYMADKEMAAEIAKEVASQTSAQHVSRLYRKRLPDINLTMEKRLGTGFNLIEKEFSKRKGGAFTLPVEKETEFMGKMIQDATKAIRENNPTTTRINRLINENIAKLQAPRNHTRGVMLSAGVGSALSALGLSVYERKKLKDKLNAKSRRNR
jgi:hypothetical protein